MRWAPALADDEEVAWQLTEDVGRYLSAAGDFLRARPAEHTVLLTVAESIQASSDVATGRQAAVFGWLPGADGGAEAAFMHTPPYPVSLSPMTAGAAASLAGVLADAGRAPIGVSGGTGPAEAFAVAWQARTRCLVAVHRRMRLHRLERLRPPEPGPSGTARPARPADRGLLVDWVTDFGREVADPVPGAERMVEERLRHGGFVLWETGGQPVSLAGMTRQVAGQVRVGPVYTPPQFRGCGFAAGATSAVTRAALDAGAREVVLFTDLANPTSNDLYQRLGYRPVSDWAMLLFRPAGPRRR